MGFFQYYSWEFDYRSEVVSIRTSPSLYSNNNLSGASVTRLGRVTKARKCEESSWPSHSRLAVEDPFETFYDVAHVMRSSQWAHVRREFIVSHFV